MNISPSITSITLDDLHFSFPNKTLFKECNLQFPSNEVSSILGPSGCGKSTLFKLMTGLLQPQKGSLQIGNEKEWEKNVKKIAFMQQDDLLLPWLSAYDNIMLPISIAKKGADRTLVENIIDEFSLRSSMHLYPHELSGGLRKRVALIRTYAMDREIILLDEPFSSLDYFTRHALYEWLQALQQKIPRTTILITHDLEEAILMSNNIYVFAEAPHTTIKIVRNQGQYPRTPEDMMTDTSICLKKELLTCFGNN